mmetsp:Transcript_10712/g.32793  ORF Transcript_10712/g.32793 Transcript_10712/m.32793 type:complete len:219 (+) Transcript_10712:3456-4112(+)
MSCVSQHVVKDACNVVHALKRKHPIRATVARLFLHGRSEGKDAEASAQLRYGEEAARHKLLSLVDDLRSDHLVDNLMRTHVWLSKGDSLHCDPDSLRADFNGSREQFMCVLVMATKQVVVEVLQRISQCECRTMRKALFARQTKVAARQLHSGLNSGEHAVQKLQQSLGCLTRPCPLVPTVFDQTFVDWKRERGSGCSHVREHCPIDQCSRICLSEPG